MEEGQVNETGKTASIRHLPYKIYQRKKF